MECYKNGVRMKRILSREAFFILQQKRFDTLYTLINFANKIFQRTLILFHSIVCPGFFMRFRCKECGHVRSYTIIIIAINSRKKNNKYILNYYFYNILLLVSIIHCRYIIVMLHYFSCIQYMLLDNQHLLKIFTIKQKLFKAIYLKIFNYCTYFIKLYLKLLIITN